jgi:hypothetical protein
VKTVFRGKIFFMKLILEYSSSNGVESWDHVIPFEYPSKEQAEYDLLTLWEDYQKDLNSPELSGRFLRGDIIFAGHHEINLNDFTYYSYDKLHKKDVAKYTEPSIMTVDEWFEWHNR